MKKSKGSKLSEVKLPPDWGKVNGVHFGDFNHFVGQPTTWEELKQKGKKHYKTNAVEPIDLYKSAGMFNHFARCSIIKYAFRLKDVEDVHKVIHYAQLLLASMDEKCEQ